VVLAIALGIVVTLIGTYIWTVRSPHRISSGKR
jgi:hypothetical protein